MSKNLTLGLSLILILVSSLSVMFHLSSFPFSTVEKFSNTVNLSSGKTVETTLQNIQKGDKIMVALNTTAMTSLQIQTGQGVLFQAPYSVEGRPFEYIDYLIDTKRYFFVSNESGDCTLQFHALTAETPFSIQTTGNPEVQVSPVIKSGLSFLNISARADKNTAENTADRFPQIFLTYELGFAVQGNFKIQGVLGLAEGGVASVDLDIIIPDRNALLTYQFMPFYAESGWSESFEVNATSEGVRLGDYLSFLRVSITLDKSHSYFTNNSFVYADTFIR